MTSRMAKRPVVVAAAAALGVLVWLWPRSEPPPPPAPHRSEQPDVPESFAADLVREAVPFTEHQPLPVDAVAIEETAAEAPAAVEALPAWIDEAKFVEAGLTREQSAELVEGMRILHGGRQLFGKDPERSNHGPDLCALIMLELGPMLAARIKEGTVSLRWTPRLEPWPQFAGNSFAWTVTPEAAEPLSYSAHGRIGFVSLEIPRKVCDQRLWALMAKASATK
jgi:hypothetical protein